MSLSITTYRLENFESEDIMSRDNSDSNPDDKYLMEYSNKRTVEKRVPVRSGSESSERDIKMDTDFPKSDIVLEDQVSDPMRLRLGSAEEDSSNDSASFEIRNKADNLKQMLSKDKTVNQENTENSANSVTVRKTSFSVSDILDPQKFIGCSGNRTPVWHPWLRDDMVQDYSKSNLDREEKLKGSYSCFLQSLTNTPVVVESLPCISDRSIYVFRNVFLYFHHFSSRLLFFSLCECVCVCFQNYSV